MKSAKTEIVRLDPSWGKPLRIVGDAAIAARGVLGGKLIPLLIVDTSHHPNVEELIRVHHNLDACGDVNFQWGQLENQEGTVALCLTFVRPFEASLIVQFDIVSQGCLVDQAILGRAIYFQSLSEKA